MYVSPKIGKMEGKILEMHNDGWNMGEGFGFDVVSEQCCW